MAASGASPDMSLYRGGGGEGGVSVQGGGGGESDGWQPVWGSLMSLLQSEAVPATDRGSCSWGDNVPNTRSCSQNVQHDRSRLLNRHSPPPGTELSPYPGTELPPPRDGVITPPRDGVITPPPRDGVAHLRRMLDVRVLNRMGR